jgi:hypothetical protein
MIMKSRGGREKEERTGRGEEREKLNSNLGAIFRKNIPEIWDDQGGLHSLIKWQKDIQKRQDLHM